jgi:hypothetical protein
LSIIRQCIVALIASSLLLEQAVGVRDDRATGKYTESLHPLLDLFCKASAVVKSKAEGLRNWMQARRIRWISDGSSRHRWPSTVIGFDEFGFFISVSEGGGKNMLCVIESKS